MSSFGYTLDEQKSWTPAPFLEHMDKPPPPVVYQPAPTMPRLRWSISAADIGVVIADGGR